MWKGAAAANSVRNAVFASLVSQRGLTGPYQPFAGEMGFFAFSRLRLLPEVSGVPFDEASGAEVGRDCDGAAPTRIQDTCLHQAIRKWPVEYHAAPTRIQRRGCGGRAYETSLVAT